MKDNLLKVFPSRYIIVIIILYYYRSGVFIANFEHISHIVLMFTLLTLNKQIPTSTVFKMKFPWDQ